MIKMILMGTGTSHGVPSIACKCPVCSSKDRRDKRLRCSAYVISKNKDKSESHILIDIGPDFRTQALKYKVDAVDAVLITHGHVDHLNGLDDIRIFSHTRSSSNLINPEVGKETEGNGIPFFADKSGRKIIKSHFDYIFKETQIGGGKPKIRLEKAKSLKTEKYPEFGDMKVLPVKMLHGRLRTTGYLLSCKKGKEVHSIAYLTDCSEINEESIEMIKNNCGVLDHLVIDGLKIEPHSTHMSFLQAMEVAEKIKPKYTWFTHMCHNCSHEEILAYAQEHLNEFPELSKIVSEGGSVGPAYDGLRIRTL